MGLFSWGKNDSARQDTVSVTESTPVVPADQSVGGNLVTVDLSVGVLQDTYDYLDKLRAEGAQEVRVHFTGAGDPDLTELVEMDIQQAIEKRGMRALMWQ